VIVDNLSAHKTKRVEAFLGAHPRVHLHFTPTYSSWLNQVELWFAKIERDLLARGIVTSIADLARLPYFRIAEVAEMITGPRRQHILVCRAYRRGDSRTVLRNCAAV
jgi:hypothetical protein